LIASAARRETVGAFVEPSGSNDGNLGEMVMTRMRTTLAVLTLAALAGHIGGEVDNGKRIQKFASVLTVAR
jgi:hypothetical protein